MACGSGAFLVETCRYLGDRLLEAWDLAEKQYPDAVRITPEGKPSTGDPAELLIPKDANERLIYARRLVAQKCLYGVDKNALAVEMAKLSLWLLTLERNRPFTFLDHAIKCGDSLLGVTRREQVETFDFEPQPAEEKQISLWKKASKVLFDRALDCRRRLEASPVMTVADVEHKEELLEQAEQATSLVRLLCDLLTAAAISTATGKRPRSGDAFTEKRVELWRTLMETYRYDENVESWRDTLVSMGVTAQKLLDEGNPYAASVRHPFHWPVEFPEVLAERGGFDAIVGNPPFMGGQKITGILGTDYRNYLVSFLAGGQRGSADLCAYFFLRARDLLGSAGGFGLLATNTIAQGNTREVGLDQLVERGAVLSRATASRKWPGQANLEIAEVWLRCGVWKGEIVLDGKTVVGINAQLAMPGAVQGTPYPLVGSQNKSFQGSNILGMGFTMTPEEAEQLVAKEPRNREVLFPFLNGEDLNSRPDQSPSRWVISFRDWPLDRLANESWLDLDPNEQKLMLRTGTVSSDYPGPVAADYPDCLAILESKVKPDRNRLASGDATARDRARRWWQFARPTTQLYDAIAGMPRALVACIVTHHLSFAFQPCNIVFAHRLVAFPLPHYGQFGLLQSNVHEPWARLYSSQLETRLNYSPSDCLETFPFPESVTNIDQIGERYYNHRREIMLNRSQGLTATYNRLHDDSNHDQDIKKLRDLQVEMDNAVTAAYGWKDLDLGHGFHPTKQGVRFTFAEEARRTVLDRLLRLNHERHAAEAIAGINEKGRKRRKPPKTEKANAPSLF
jgi:hypothetical protein